MSEEKAVDLSALANPAPAVEPKPGKIKTPPELISPEGMGYMNTLVAAAVREAVQAAMAGIAPMIEGSQLTREKLLILSGKDPEQEAAARARLKRERQEWGVQEDEARAQKLAMQRACPHQYSDGKEAINLNRNWPDRQPRGICVLCGYMIQPKHWEILAPDPTIADIHERRKTQAKLVEEDPLYFRVRRKAATERVV